MRAHDLYSVVLSASSSFCFLLRLFKCIFILPSLSSPSLSRYSFLLTFRGRNALFNPLEQCFALMQHTMKEDCARKQLFPPSFFLALSCLFLDSSISQNQISSLLLLLFFFLKTCLPSYSFLFLYSFVAQSECKMQL